MTIPYLVTKSPKSVGLAILLTVLFGPFGLLYASVLGGLIMIFIPIFPFLFFIAGVIQQNIFLVLLSSGLLLFTALAFWLISIIWAVISVISYNKNIEDENNRQFELWDRLNKNDQKQIIINVNKESPEISTSGQGARVSSKPSLAEWAKSNPGKSINDYYAKFG